MLPFIKKQKMSTGLVTEYRKPDDAEKSEKEADGLEMAAEDMIRAHSAGDKKALAAALRAAFAILDSEPHVEGPHLEESEE